MDTDRLLLGLTERECDNLWTMLGIEGEYALIEFGSPTEKLWDICAEILILPVDESPEEHGMLIVAGNWVPIVSGCLIQGEIPLPFHAQ